MSNPKELAAKDIFNNNPRNSNLKINKIIEWKPDTGRGAK